MRRAVLLGCLTAILAGAPAQAARIVHVRVGSPAAARRLAALQLDTSEVVSQGQVAVVLHAATDGRRLRAAGFRTVTPVRARAATAAPGTLPSGRTSYRSFADYEADIARLAAHHPHIARRVRIGTSVLGRPLEGLQIAARVRRSDDGRPVHVELGLTHAREWPSGEVVMEYAFDLVHGYRHDPRITRLVRHERTFLFPVVNPDGLVASRAGDPTKRKNCSGGPPGTCGSGVDLNRNASAYWGGPGASDDPASAIYRGPAPLSEPESTALHHFSARLQITVIDSVHTYGGQVLYQPGFSDTDEPRLPAGSELPGHQRWAAAAADLAGAAGYAAEPASELYDATGAVEDWNSFTQGALAFTTEVGYDTFAPPYRQGVIEQYLGTDPSHPAAGGVRELLLRAGEAALDPANGALLHGRARPGRTLHLTRRATTTTSYILSDTDTPDPFTGPAMTLPEHLRSTLRVPPSGRYRWHVDPSTGPVGLLDGRIGTWTLTCGRSRRHVALAAGDRRRVNLRCRRKR